MTLLALKNLSISHHDTPLLASVSLAIEHGDKIGLIGASGAGKSLLSLAMMGLLPPNFQISGTMLINGEAVDLTDDAIMRYRRGTDIAMIFQDPRLALNPIKPVAAQIAEAAELALGVSRVVADDMALDSLTRVGLDPEIIAPDSLPDMLSGGQCQRVMIAMAIIGSPKLLIADEPTTSLDTVTQAEILALLKQLADEDDMALFMISHDLAILAQTVDQIHVLDQGKLVDHAASPPFAKTLTHHQSQQLIEASRLDIAPPPVATDPNHQAGQDIILAAAQISVTYASGFNVFGIADRNKPILRDVSLTLRRGECLGLVGTSGAGKSTLTRMLLGLERPQQGEVMLAGDVVDPKRMTTAMRRRISAVFQDPYSAFNPRHSVRRIIAEPLGLLNRNMDQNMTDQAITEKVAHALELVGLAADMMHRYIHAFSGGQRQRIAIARALITNPEVILFDEATASLDTLIRKQILALISDLVAANNLSAVFISHDLAVIRAICHRVMVLDDGQCVESGETEHIFHDPQHAATRRLLNAIPNSMT